MAQISEFFKFQNASTAIGQGATLSVSNRNSMVVDIFGTNVATRTINFYKLNMNNPPDLVEINGFNISSNILATSTTGTGSETWQFDDISGFNQIIMKIDTMTGTGANTTVIGTVML